MKSTLLLAISTAWALGACAAAGPAYKTPDHWEKSGYAWPPDRERTSESEEDSSKTLPAHGERSLAKHLPPPISDRKSSEIDQASPPRSGNIARIAPPEPTRAFRLKGNKCLKDLKKRNIQFRPLSELKGVENPVEIHGTLGGVTFWANDGRKFEMDCRLALTLDSLGPVFRKYGVTRVRYSGTYSYRRTRSGRLSHHALGLAIDIHELEFKNSSVSVENDFEKNVGCSSRNTHFNQLVCALRQTRLFEEFLTPDFNYDHRDHLHISVPRWSKLK